MIRYLLAISNLKGGQLDGSWITEYLLHGSSGHKVKILKEIIINKIDNINKVHDVHICNKINTSVNVNV